MENEKNVIHINHIFTFAELEEIRNGITTLSLFFVFEDNLVKFFGYFKFIFRKHFPKDYKRFFKTRSWFADKEPIGSDLIDLPFGHPEKIFWLSIIENSLQRIEIYESKLLEFHIPTVDPKIEEIKVILVMFKYKVFGEL